MNLRGSSDFRPGAVAALMEQVIPMAIRATTRATAIVGQTARSLAPVGETGDLSNSIETETALIGQLVTGSVEATVPYAAFVEYGTGIRGAASDHGELPTEGVPFTGSWIYDFRGRGWLGMPARPFLRPALDQNSSQILGAFASEGFYV